NGAYHLRLHAEVTERLDQARRRLRLAGRVRARLLARGTRQQAARIRQFPDEVRVVRDDVAQPPLRRQLGRVGARHARHLLLLAPVCVERALLGRGRLLAGGRSACAGQVRLPRLACLPAGALLCGTLDVRGTHHQLVPPGVGRLHERVLGELVEIEAFGRCVLLALLVAIAAALTERAHHPRGLGHAAAGRPQGVAERGAGDEDRADEQEEQDEDVHAHVLDQAVRELVQRLTDHAPVRLHEAGAPCDLGVGRARADAERAGRQRERDPGVQAGAADRARIARQRPAGGQQLTQQQRATGADERERREHACASERPAERDGEPVAGASAVPATPQHEPHEHADGDERQPEHVAAPLVERADPPQAGRQQRSEHGQPARAAGAAGRACVCWAYTTNFDTEPAEPPLVPRTPRMPATAGQASPPRATDRARRPRPLSIVAPGPYHRFSARRYLKTMDDFSRAPRVLVVEDDEDIAQALQRSLRMEGYEVRAAGDGPTALENGRSFAPELVILDLGLPGLDGVEVAKTLRAEDDVPILILTA